MKGMSVLNVTQETIIQAVQEYLERRTSGCFDAPVVASVKPAVSSEDNPRFTIMLEERTFAAPKEEET